MPARSDLLSLQRTLRSQLRQSLRLSATVLATALTLSAIAAAAVAAQTTDPFQDLRWRNIGPANPSGRVVDIDAVEANPAIVYVASASGGVWKSVNAGTTWAPIFTRYGTANIGDVTIYQKDPNIVWVGTGEACVRNSVGWGDGVYKSTDGGATFVNVGLKESHHIGRIVTHPTNPDIVYVAAGGHLWGTNPERGIFKTVDGGRNWQRLAGGLPQDDSTGASDIAMDPSNPNILYAGMWPRQRFPYVFNSGGMGGGIYKSTNGGTTWTKLTRGLPQGPIGKVTFSIYRKNPRIISAIVEANQTPDLSTPGTGIYRSEDGGANWTYMNRNNSRPFYYSHIHLDPNNPNRLYYLTVPAQVSEDGGRTFTRNLPGIEGDFHAMWIDPNNSDRFYIGNDKGASVTYDGGYRFIMFDNMDIAQFYAVTADNRDPYYVYGGMQDSGNWGGPTNSRDYNGILNDHWFKFHSGDGFHTTVDYDDWRIVYTETQNGGLRRLDATFRQMGEGISPSPATIINYAEVFPPAPAAAAPPPAAGAAGAGAAGSAGGRGGAAAAGGRGGARGGGGGGGRGGGAAIRYNWSSPLILSPHDSKTLMLGGQYIFRSTDRGDTWRIISPDLSTNDPSFRTPSAPGWMGERTSAETYASLISVVESPLVPGLIWAGTDDGNVQVTRDDGRSWTNVRPNIPATVVPARLWVSRVEPSHFDAATAYVSFDGHRSNNFRPYVVKTADYGRTWTNITANLPAAEPVYVVKEDLRNPNLLFVGTSNSVYASIDAGRSWQKFMTDFPVVQVHDLVIHPRENDLIAATHGRGMWIMDDITPLQQLTPEVQALDAHLFKNKVATIWRAVSRGATRGHLMFQGKNPLTIAMREPANSPNELTNTAVVNFYLRTAGTVRLEIASLDGARQFAADVTGNQGINRYYWDMRLGAAGAPAATAAAGGGGGRGGRGGGGGAGRGAGAAAAGGAAAGGAAAGRAAGAAAGGGAGAGAAGAAAAGAAAGDAPPAAPQGRGGGGGGAAAAGPGTYRVRLIVGGRTMEGTLSVRADPATSGSPFAGQ